MNVLTRHSILLSRLQRSTPRDICTTRSTPHDLSFELYYPISHIYILYIYCSYQFNFAQSIPTFLVDQVVAIVKLGYNVCIYMLAIVSHID